MAAPALSVIIPTHKRARILGQCLEHLAKQTIASQLEVIVISDGPDEATADLMTHIAKTQKFASLQYGPIPKSQQGIARNRGVAKATAPITLFIGDDAFLAPDACEKHVAAQKANGPCAVLGFTTWDPALDINNTMRWLEKTGWQFGYNMLIPYRHAFVPQKMQHRFSYTINISLPTDIAKQFPFREDVTLYGWEDILWGQQLRDADVALYYEPDALALHHHLVTLGDSLERIETLGKSLLHLTEIAPELDRKPTGLKLWAYHLIALTPTMRGRHYRAFLKGLRSA